MMGTTDDELESYSESTLKAITAYINNLFKDNTGAVLTGNW